MSRRPLITALRTDGRAVVRGVLRNAQRAGRRIRLWGRARVAAGRRILVGDRVLLSGAFAPIELVADRNAVLVIGEGTFIKFECNIAVSEAITIGPECNIGP
jgi:acetyltransferase-like isoleucine patch superfamily enzyme